MNKLIKKCPVCNDLPYCMYILHSLVFVECKTCGRRGCCSNEDVGAIANWNNDLLDKEGDKK